MKTLHVDRRVEGPINQIAFLEFLGLAFDTGMILEDEFKVGRRTSLNKIDKYFYRTMSSLLRNKGRPYIPFK